MTEDEIIAFAAGLPGVTVETASAGSGAPEVAWGDSLVYYDPPGAEPEPPDRRWPFATLVIHDYAGFDESSRLDRDGVFRVNVNVGKSRFEELVGYPPSQHAERRGDHDYTELDVLLPHPEYGQQAPEVDGPVQVALTWFCPDADAAFERAVEAGAIVVAPPSDAFHGDRTATVRCPFGHRWIIATHVRDVPLEEQQRAFREMVGA